MCFSVIGRSTGSRWTACCPTLSTSRRRRVRRRGTRCWHHAIMMALHSSSSPCIQLCHGCHSCKQEAAMCTASAPPNAALLEELIASRALRCRKHLDKALQVGAAERRATGACTNMMAHARTIHAGMELCMLAGPLVAPAACRRPALRTAWRTAWLRTGPPRTTAPLARTPPPAAP